MAAVPAAKTRASVSRLRGGSRITVDNSLPGSRFRSIDRHGKILLAALSAGPYLIFQFGMTGCPNFYDAAEPKPAHPRLVLTFADAGHFAYHDRRRLGWRERTPNIERYLRERDNGPDALKLSRQVLADCLRPGRAMLKSRLLGQTVLAGIGNVPATAIQVGATSSRMPTGCLTLTPRRGTDYPCPRCRDPLQARKIAGRTTSVLPRLRESSRAGAALSFAACESA